MSEINKLWVHGVGGGTYTDVFSLQRTSLSPPPPPPILAGVFFWQHAGSFRVEFYQFADSSHAKNKAEHPADLFWGVVFQTILVNLNKYYVQFENFEICQRFWHVCRFSFCTRRQTVHKSHIHAHPHQSVYFTHTHHSVYVTHPHHSV